jgi:hypothetical protein
MAAFDPPYYISWEETPPPRVSQEFRFRVLNGGGASIPNVPFLGAGRTFIEIVDTRNHLRRIYWYFAISGSVDPGIMPFGASNTTEWRDFTTTVPMSVNNFHGDIQHLGLTISAGIGWSADYYWLFAPVAYGGASVKIEYRWDTSSDFGLPAVDIGRLDPINSQVLADEVDEGYFMNNGPSPFDLI